MSRSFQRPENALKRATEFIDVGKPTRALEVLYEVIKRGKMRTNCSEKLLEPIMFKYLELCVDLKKSHLAKEGLYQYRNIFQSVSVSSLETVVRYYLQLADERTEAARKESHQAVVDIDDLDNLATPEEILLSAVSGEDAQDRSDRTILTPWVKFLWESYRQCLELLRTNSRVERLYHDIARQAFKFCEKYTRKTEFRKLCDNLRTHLSLIQKQQGSATSVNLNNPETQQMNLETRLEQLNYAIKMELWQEAYKAIEDISDLMNKSKKMPKPHVMASYYQKLSLVFWKAGNQLFHAAALFKLFQLLRDQKKNITADEVGKRASVVLIATLAIPLPSAHPEFDRFIETEKSALEKIDKLATLLSLPKPPTRASLIRDLVRYNVVTSVPPELQNLYTLMEVEFDPLHICSRVQTHLKWITEHAELGSSLTQYVGALQEMTITRLVKQVAQVYQTVTFKRLLELAVFVQPFQLERILVDLVRHNDLQIRIDHRSECVNFGTDLSESQREDLPEGPTLQTLPSENIRCQLVEMGAALQKCIHVIYPNRKKLEMEPMRAQTIQMYQNTRSREHMKILQRQHIIEERKEMLENQNLEREESIRRAQEEQLKRKREEELQRLEREASKRERERQEEQLKQIQSKQIKDKLAQIKETSYGQKMIGKLDEAELLNLGAEGILQRQVEELEKERKELQQRLKAQEKKVDYLERAKRQIEIPLLNDKLAEQKEKEKEIWHEQEQERVTKLIEEHRIALDHSKRLSRMREDRDNFLESLKNSRRSEIEKKLNDFNARLEVERKKRLAERKEQRRRERREAWLHEKEEEEQRRRDEELKQQREEEERLEREKREKDEEEYARRKADLDRQMEKQREKERLIEERMKERDYQRKDEREPEDSGWRRPPPRNIDQKKTDDLSGSKGEDEDNERSQAWKRGGGAWREKEREKVGSWLRKDEDQDGDDGGRDDDRGKDDNRFRGGREERFRGDRDIRRTAEFKRDMERDRDRGDGREERTDWRRGPPRDTDKTPSRDNDRLRDMDRPPRDRDMDRPPRDRDMDRPPRDREYDRRDMGRDRDYDRRDFDRRDREYDRRDMGRDRDRDRDDRGFRRGGLSSRGDDGGGSWRSAGPPPEIRRRDDRGGGRDDRGDRFDRDRGGGGGRWRRNEDGPRRDDGLRRDDGPRRDGPRRDDGPKEERLKGPRDDPDHEGWTMVGR